MVKTCRELAKDIEKLKEKLRENRIIELTLADISDKKRCESNNASSMCRDCNCWKSAREYCS